MHYNNLFTRLQGIEKTERGKHDGGDAAWEEQRLGSYKRSEIRLVEIQEWLCKDVLLGEDQCHALAETSEALIEEWWFKKHDETAGETGKAIKRNDLLWFIVLHLLQIFIPGCVSISYKSVARLIRLEQSASLALTATEMASVKAVELAKETENAHVTLGIRVKHAMNVITNSMNHSVMKQSCYVAYVM